MSGEDTDQESVYDDHSEKNDDQEQSESEYQSDDNDGNSSVESRRNQRSKDALNTETNKTKGFATSAALPSIKSTKATYSDAYRDFYNETVEELVNPFLAKTDALPSSEIDAISWTPLEKEVLFQKIPTLGRDNIKAIAVAIGTKSEIEVHQYLKLLDQGLTESNVTLSLPVFSASDVPAAFEVSKQCEDVLEEYADGLAQFQQRGDQKREKKRHGDYWLLTEDVAQEIEDQIHARQKNNGEEEEDGEEKASGPADAGSQDGDAEQGAEEERSSIEKSSSQTSEPEKEQGTSIENGIDDDLDVPAAELLDLPTWLRLTQLFMYQSQTSTENWTNFINSPKETPSMYHSTFQDFHNLTVSLTRRLVQATFFQAMTRLRARDRDQPSAVVTSGDVRTAAEILDLKHDKHKFWGLIPRKHGLKVYERGKGFSKGQSRRGAELDLNEAEEKLGVALSSLLTRNESKDGVEESIENGDDAEDDDILDPDQYYEDSELWTDCSVSGYERSSVQADIPEVQDSDASDEGEDPAYHPPDKDEEGQPPVRRRSRKKGELDREFQKAHDGYLEALDREMSRNQELELWNAIKVPPPTEIKDEEVEIPGQPVIKRRLQDTANWRDDLQFQAPWEREADMVQPEEFARMHVQGEQGRKRRRLAYDYLEKERLVQSSQQPIQDTVARKKSGEHNTDKFPRKSKPIYPLVRARNTALSLGEGSHVPLRRESTFSIGSVLAAAEQSRLRNIEAQQEQEQTEEVDDSVLTKEDKKAAGKKTARQETRKIREAEEKRAQEREAEEARKRAEQVAEKLAQEKVAKKKAKEEKSKLKEERRQAKAEVRSKRKEEKKLLSRDQIARLRAIKDKSLTTEEEEHVEPETTSEKRDTRSTEEEEHFEAETTSRKRVTRSMRAGSDRKGKRKSGF